MSTDPQQKKSTGQEVMELDAVVREGLGTAACRRLRRQERLPANLYGHKQGNIYLSDHNSL